MGCLLSLQRPRRYVASLGPRTWMTSPVFPIAQPRVMLPPIFLQISITASLLQSQWLLHPYLVQDGEGLSNIGVNQEGGLKVPSQSQGCLFSVIHLPRLKILFWDRTCRQGLLVQGSVLWPFYSSSGLHQSACSGFGMGSQERDFTNALSG